MLKYVVLDLRMFKNGMTRLNKKGLLAFLEALTCWDEIYLEENPETPPLYQSGVRYAIPEQFQKRRVRPEKIYAALRGVGIGDRDARRQTDIYVNGENFRDIASLMENRVGDCDNVATTRAAELRSCGIDASPFITSRTRSDGGTTIHVVTRYPDNTIEDPSLILGMGGKRRHADRLEALRQLAERREMIASQIVGARAVGKEFSEEDMARLKRLSAYLAPPPPSFYVEGFDPSVEE